MIIFLRSLAIIWLFMLVWSIPAFCGEIHGGDKSGDPEKIITPIKGKTDLVSGSANKDTSLVSLCDVLKNPSSYAGKTITLAVRVISMDHHIFLENPECPKLSMPLLIRCDLALGKGMINLCDEVHKKNGSTIATLTGTVNTYFIDVQKTYPFFEVIAAKDIKTFSKSLGSRKNSPIHDAAETGDLAKIKTLLKDNPELVFDKNGDGMTPLHMAAREGHMDLVELLLSNKADVHTKNVEGETPLFLATKYGYKAVVELLLANSADVNAKDKYGRTPLRLAVAYNHKDIEELLRQHGGHEWELKRIGNSEQP
jgi:hypothetical protein